MGARASAAASRSPEEIQGLPLILVHRSLIQSRQSVGASAMRVPTGGGGEVGRAEGKSEGGDGVRECFWPASGEGVRKRPIVLPAGST